MKCPQKIVITVNHGKNFIDIEIPTDYTIDNIKKSIITTINSYYKDNKVDDSISEESKLYYNEKQLDESKILANYGIWDGSIVILR